MSRRDLETHIHAIATSRCDSLHKMIMCFGESDGEEPPCNICVREVCEELEKNRGKAHGIELSPEEAAEVRKSLGVE